MVFDIIARWRHDFEWQHASLAQEIAKAIEYLKNAKDEHGQTLFEKLDPSPDDRFNDEAKP